MRDEHGDRCDVVVAGAGVAGLAAAALAAGDGRRVVVIDAHRPGGRATTDERGGFRFNQGAHAVYRGGSGRRVLGRLGITPRGAKPPTRGSMGLRDGRVGLLPAGPLSLLRTRMLSPKAKLDVARALARLPRLDAAAHADHSAAAWIASLGVRPDAAAMLESIVHVTSYANDLRDLAADAAIGQLQLGLGAGVDYLDGGWQQLVDALVAAVEGRGATLVTGAPVSAVEPHGDRWIVRAGDRSFAAAAVVVAVGGPDATRSLLPVEPGWGALGPDQTAVCLQLGLRRMPRHRLVFGVGEPLYLNTHCPPADLAPPGHVVVEAMRYGARGADEDRSQLWALAHAAGIEDADVVEQRFLRRMVVAHAQPAPGLGLPGRPGVEVAGAPGLFVAGDWVGPVGMLADASYASAEAAARAAVAHVAALGAPA